MDHELETTKGRTGGDWDSAIEVGGSDKTSSVPNDYNSSSKYGDVVKHFPGALNKVELNSLHFTIMIVSIVGYIVIASFGEMDTKGKYFGYIIFLLLMFCGYKILKGSILKNLVNSTNKIMLFVTIILIIIVFFQNIDLLVDFFKVHGKYLLFFAK